MVWFEVETKIRVEDINDIRKKIRSIAKFQKKQTRDDEYFALKRKFRKHAYPKKAFRIREKSGEYEINFKKGLKKYWDDEVVVKEEFEFAIKNKENVDDLLTLFKDLGFVEWIKKQKISESYTHKKDKRIIIEINKVKHLGTFVEIEYLCKLDEIEKAKRKIKETLKELGIDKKDIDNTGYTKMLWKKRIGIKN